MRHPLDRHRSSAGFSLVELLVAIAVVSVLITFVYVGTGGIAAAGDRMRCISNLRQIGAAIFQYAQDHGGTLPGSTVTVQRWEYNSLTVRKGAGLTVWLAPYLSLPEPKNRELMTASPFVCPGTKRQVGDSTTVNASYGARGTFLEGSTAKILPFGYYDSSKDKETLPYKIQNIPMELSKVHALVDSDRLVYPAINYLPALPSHGDMHNALYLDGHVGPFVP